MHEITVTAEWLSSTLPLAYDTAKFLSGVTGGADYDEDLRRPSIKRPGVRVREGAYQLPIVMYFTLCVPFGRFHMWSRDIGSSYRRVARSIWMGYKTHSFIVRKIRNHKTNLNLFAILRKKNIFFFLQNNTLVIFSYSRKIIYLNLRSKNRFICKAKPLN